MTYGLTVTYTRPDDDDTTVHEVEHSVDAETLPAALQRARIALAHVRVHAIALLYRITEDGDRDPVDNSSVEMTDRRAFGRPVW